MTTIDPAWHPCERMSTSFISYITDCYDVSRLNTLEESILIFLTLKTKRLGQKMIEKRENQGTQELIIQSRKNLHDSEGS